MKNSKFSLPPKYWIYVLFCGVMSIFLFVNIFISDTITGDKEFYDYDYRDWLYFVFFIVSELLIGFLMFFFSVRAGNIMQQIHKQRALYYEQFKYDGIKPGDYNDIWFDFSGDERAKILTQGNAFLLYVEKFDIQSESWNSVNTVSCFDSIDAVRKSLYYDFNFYCDENAELDEHEDVTFKH